MKLNEPVRQTLRMAGLILSGAKHAKTCSDLPSGLIEIRINLPYPYICSAEDTLISASAVPHRGLERAGK